jgi:hypothetical protein
MVFKLIEDGRMGKRNRAGDKVVKLRISKNA